MRPAGVCSLSPRVGEGWGGLGAAAEGVAGGGRGEGRRVPPRRPHPAPREWSGGSRWGPGLGEFPGPPQNFLREGMDIYWPGRQICSGDRAGGSEGGWGTRPWSARSAGKGPFVLGVVGEGDIAANNEPTGKASPGACPWNAPAGAGGGRAERGGNGSRSCAPQEGVLGMAGGELLLMCEPEGVLSRGRRLKVQRGCAASRILCSAAEVMRKKDWFVSGWTD